MRPALPGQSLNPDRIARTGIKRHAWPITTLVLVWAMLVLTALLQPVQANEPARDQLTIGITQFPSNWHPLIEAMASKHYVLSMARRPLTTYDADWQLTCMVCVDLPTLENGQAVVETRADGTTGVAVTYAIHPDARWGDGTPVTTADVLFTWEAGRHPQSGFSNGDLFARDILAIDALDEHRFLVHRAKPVCTAGELNNFELLPAHLERPVFEADPASYRNRSTYETDTTNPGLWFGPYKITAVDPGSHVVLEPNPTWWGRKPAFRRIVVRAVENTAAMEANLMAGQIDMIPGEAGLPLDQVLAFEKRGLPTFKITYKPGLFFEHIDLNLDNPVLADVRLRRALLHAVDREAISQQLFDGRQPVAHNGVSPLDPVHVPGYATYGFDPALAARLLDEAGWRAGPGGIRRNAAGDRLTLEIATTAGNRSRELLQQVLQAQWRQAGIEVRIANEPARVLFGQSLSQRRFKGMALFAWLSSPENIPRTLYHSTMIPTAENNWAGQNFTGYHTAAMDQVLDDLETVCEPEARKNLWATLQARYAEDLPNLPLFHRVDPTITPAWLVGVTPTGHQGASSLWVEDWSVQ